MIAFGILFAVCLIIVFRASRSAEGGSAASTIIAAMGQFVRGVIALLAILVAIAVVVFLFIEGDWLARITLVLVVGFGLTIFAVAAGAQRIAKEMEKSREAVLEAMTEIRESNHTDSPPVAADQNTEQTATPSLVIQPDESAQARREQLHREPSFNA